MQKQLVYVVKACGHVPVDEGSLVDEMDGRLKDLTLAGEYQHQGVLCLSKQGFSSVVQNAATQLRRRGYQAVALTDVRCESLDHALQVAHAYAEHHRLQPLFLSHRGLLTGEQVLEIVRGMREKSEAQMRAGNIPSSCFVGRVTGEFPKVWPK